MREEVRRQLSAVHRMEIPAAKDAVCRNWSDDPFGGGWNTWNIGIQSEKVMGKMAKPFIAVPLYICGDAYSNFQGWAEGALETADMVLEKILKTS
jgi:monoamine oxidase